MVFHQQNVFRQSIFRVFSLMFRATRMVQSEGVEEYTEIVLKIKRYLFTLHVIILIRLSLKFIIVYRNHGPFAAATAAAAAHSNLPKN